MTRNLQEHILQTASALFYSQGIKSTGIDAIVKATGVAKMSLYKYYSSKDELVLAHLHKSSADMQVMLENALLAAGDQPKFKLLAIFKMFAEFAAAPDFRGCPFVNALAEYADLDSPVRESAAEFYQQFTDLLTCLAKQMDAAQPQQLAQQLTLLVVGATVNEQIQRQSGAITAAYAAAEVLIDQQINASKSQAISQ